MSVIIPLLWREIKAQSGRTSIVTLLAAPTMLFLLLGVAFGSTISGIGSSSGTSEYLMFLAPGLVSLSLISVLNMSFAHTRIDRVTNLLDVILLSQAKIHDYFIARSLFFLLLVAGESIYVTVLLFIITGILPSFFAFLGLTLIVALLAPLWVAIGMMAGCFFDREITRDLVFAFVPQFLSWSSTAFYDLSNAPVWLSILSTINPLTVCVNIGRAAWYGESLIVSNVDIVQLTFLVLLAVVSFLLSRHRLSYGSMGRILIT